MLKLYTTARMSLLIGLVSNGTSPWSSGYDPAAPFYGWAALTAVLAAVMVVSILLDLLRVLCRGNQSFLISPHVVVLFLGNLTGYLAAAAFLDIARLESAPGPVFMIWLLFVLMLPSSYMLLLGGAETENTHKEAAEMEAEEEQA